MDRTKEVFRCNQISINFSRRFTKSFTASLRRLKQPKDKISTVRKHSTMNTSGASILYPGRMTAKDRRLLKMILVIFVSFLICYLPITITKIIKPIEKYHFWNIISYLLIYLTTCINPIIYVVMSSEYRQAYWNLLMCRTKSRAQQQKELVQKQGSQRTWQSTLSTRTLTKWFSWLNQTTQSNVKKYSFAFGDTYKMLP